MFRLNKFQTRLYSGFGINVCEAVMSVLADCFMKPYLKPIGKSKMKIQSAYENMYVTTKPIRFQIKKVKRVDGNQNCNFFPSNDEL